jgi:cobalt-zinc-cadmium efflux system outer membrane protein
MEAWCGFWAAMLLLLGAGSARAQTPAIAPPSPQNLPRLLTLQDLIDRAVSRHPALNQAQAEVDAALGRADQAGRYPNPTLQISGEEVGRDGGIHTLPLVSQELVTRNKLGLSRAAALREVDQATWGLARQRYALIVAVRQAYFEVLIALQRQAILMEQVKLAEQTLERIQAAKGQASIVLVEPQALLELNRLRAERIAAGHDEKAARWRLATAVGDREMLPAEALRPANLVDALVALPYKLDPDEPKTVESDYAAKRAFVLSEHPEVQMARAALARADLLVQREIAQRTPNVTVGLGYQQNFNDRASQGTYQVSVPVPIFNRNQGGIREAQAEAARASYDITRVENDLSARLAAAYHQYLAATARARAYGAMLPRLQETPAQIEKLFKAGELKDNFSFLSAVQAQKALTDTKLEHVRALAEAWKAASDIAGLTLEEAWPWLSPRP